MVESKHMTPELREALRRAVVEGPNTAPRALLLRRMRRQVVQWRVFGYGVVAGILGAWCW